MKVLRITISGHCRAPLLDALQILLATGRPLHALEHIGMAVLQRHIQVRQHLARGHQRNHLVHTWVRIHIMQAHPGAIRLGQIAQRLHQFQHAGLDRLAVPEAGAVLDVHAIGRGVLADHQQFLDAAFEQRARIVQHIADRPRHQVAAHRRNDAEGAAVVAAFADLQVGIVARRQLDAGDAEGVRNQVDKRVMRLGQVGVHGIHHLLRRMRAGHGQHLGMHLAHQVAAVGARLGAQATGDDHPAVLGQRLADRVQALAHGIVDEAAGIDDHQIGTGQRLGGLVTLGAELRQDQFGVGQCLGTTQADESDRRRLGGGGG